MQKLSETIRKESYNKESTEEMRLTELDAAGEEWAKHCLKTHTGELLRKGLAISAAIADYTNELVRSSA